MGWSPTIATRWSKAPSATARNARPLGALPAVPTGCPLVYFSYVRRTLAKISQVGGGQGANTAAWLAHVGAEVTLVAAVVSYKLSLNPLWIFAGAALLGLFGVI